MNTLNRPISPTLINKCIGVALVPVALFAVVTSAKSLVNFDPSDLVGELFFTILPTVCMLTIAVFCVLFVLKAFRSDHIKKSAIVMAFVEIVCVSFLALLEAWLGGGIFIGGNGDADFAIAVILLWAFFLFYLPPTVIATVCAAFGLKSLLRPSKDEQKTK